MMKTGTTTAMPGEKKRQRGQKREERGEKIPC
jgi:hypothetical protein